MQKNSGDQDELRGVESTLKDLNEQQVVLIKETGDLFKRQVEYMKMIDDLESSRPDMEKVGSSIKHLSSTLNSVIQSDDDICSKLRRMDQVKARIDDFLSKVNGILNLRNCHDAVNDALEASNYEEAAMLIKKFLTIDRDELEKTIRIINNLSGRKINSSLLTELVECESSESESAKPTKIRRTSDIVALDDMDDARLKMLIVCQDKFAKAIKESDPKSIDRFFKIFPMLDEHEDGLRRYSEYLRTKIMTPELDNTFKSKSLNQADKLAALFETIAKLIDHNQPLIETYYGPGHLMVIVKILQAECDSLSRRILEEFRNETKLQYVAKVVKNSSMQIITSYSHGNQQGGLTSSSSGTQLSNLNLQPSKLDLVDVNKILNEISTIISRSEVYLNFLADRIREDIDCKTDDELVKQTSSLDLYNLLCTNCELNHLVQEVGGIYVMLEQFYLNEISKKAITMDKVYVEPNKSHCLSSMLDDIFIFIKKCLKRSISTKSSEVFCAITNHCVTFLEFTFCQILSNRLKSHYYSIAPFIGDNNIMSKAYNAIQAGRYMQSASEIESAKEQYFSALNNLDRACDYIQALKEVLEKDVTKLKPLILILKKHQDNRLEKSLTCLSELSDLKVKFSQVINGSIEEMFSSSIKNRLRVELKEIANENVIRSSEDNYIEGLTASLMLSLDKSLFSIMTEANYSRLLLVAQQFVASVLKSSRKQIN